MNSVLSFSKHINIVAVTLLRSFLSKDPMLLTKAFTVNVCPMLEYCSPVWSSCFTGNINKLEFVHQPFTT